MSVVLSTLTLLALAPVNLPAPAPLPQVQAPAPVEHQLVLSRTEAKTQVGDPVWQFSLMAGDKVVASMDAVSGRAHTQNLDRHVGNNLAPLPAGRYSVGHDIAKGPFGVPELGTGYWVGLTPQFKTGRTDLGIHVDPSMGKANGESGTHGCIGLKNAQATQQVVTWIETHNIKTVTVLN